MRESDRERLTFERSWSVNQKSAADFIIERVRYVLTETESRIRQRVINSLQIGSRVDAQKILKDFEEAEDLVSHIFLVRDDSRFYGPSLQPLYQTGGEPDIKLLLIPSSSLLLEAEDYEYKKHDYSAAIKTYQSLYRETNSKNLKARFLNRIARCYKKAGNSDQAISFYLTLFRDYESEKSESGLSLGVVALFALGDLYFEREQITEGIQEYFKIYSALCEGRWAITKTQFESYSLKIEERIPDENDKIGDLPLQEDLRQKWQTLTLQKTKTLRQMALIDAIEGLYIPAARKKIGNSPDTLEDVFYVSDSREGTFYVVGIMAISNGELLGFLINPEILAKKILSSVSVFPNTIKGMKIAIKDEVGNFLAVLPDVPEERANDSLPVYKQAFSDLLPTWKVLIYSYNQEDREKALISRRNIYLMIAIFITTALFFGGFMGIRSLVKQMEIVQMKSEFVATVSHELRTPLTSIRYMIELLRLGRVQKEEKKQKYYTTLNNESERLSRLIENILDFSKIEGGMKEYQFEWIDAVSLTENVAASALELAKQKGFDLKTEIQKPLPKVWMDGEAISRALFNLLDNAFKYSETSKNILLKAGSKNLQIFWEIQDFGIGIPEEKKIRIFEKFYRVPHQQENDVKGSGIGLTIVKHIVEAHKGQIKLDSKPGEGTTFTFSFPSGTKPDKSR